LFVTVSSQTTKEKKNKKNDQPKLTVVEIHPQPTPVFVEYPRTNGSLFTENSVNGDLTRDFKARYIGDLIFIDVVEENTANVTSNAKRDRDSGDVAGLVPLVGALPINGAEVAGPIIGDLGKRKFEGKGTTGRTSSLRSRITARVVEVLPNGDMRIQAVKLVKINKETEQIAVTGIVRYSDLQRDNSIATTSVGDLKVEFNGKGIASADNAPGWLFRFWDRINPF
ncbi:MAG TPA: flagellar basal body L-ring protein FlgH, partial [Pyrinomonadaceae bacterium]|nr:flagellar basal body L-ring protein FlgH [Pyrinomonadaceae bacterium]